MKQFWMFILVVLLLAGLGRFSLYAYERVQSDRSSVRESEAKLLQAERDRQGSVLADRVKREIARREKAREMMLAMFPSKQEEINNVFNSVSAEEKQDTKQPEKSIAPSEVANPQPATEKKEGAVQ